MQCNAVVKMSTSELLQYSCTTDDTGGSWWVIEPSSDKSGDVFQDDGEGVFPLSVSWHHLINIPKLLQA